MGMRCSSCAHPIPPFGASLEEGCQVETYGLPWVLRGGRPVCWECSWDGSPFQAQERHDEQPGEGDEDEEGDADLPARPATCSSREAWECWNEQLHVYRDPSASGGSGGGGGKRFGVPKQAYFRRPAPVVGWD